MNKTMSGVFDQDQFVKKLYNQAMSHLKKWSNEGKFFDRGVKDERLRVLFKRTIAFKDIQNKVTQDIPAFKLDGVSETF